MFSHGCKKRFQVYYFLCVVNIFNFVKFQGEDNNLMVEMPNLVLGYLEMMRQHQKNPTEILFSSTKHTLLNIYYAKDTIL